MMKKMSVIVIALSLAVALFSLANAGNDNGMAGGCDKCAQGGANAPSDQFRKFQADTIDLRQEMMIKRFDMQRENLKGTPDQEKIAALNADIKALQAKIQDIHTKSGLPTDKCDGECGQKMGACDKQGLGGCSKNIGGCGKGMGGCNGVPCGSRK